MKTRTRTPRKATPTKTMKSSDLSDFSVTQNGTGDWAVNTWQTLDIEPLPCPRPRIAVRGKFASAYYPKAYKDWKEDAEAKLSEVAAELRREGPLCLFIVFRVTKPRTSKLTHPSPDIDNYLKSFMDAATKAGLWEDDKQVVRVVAEKAWAPEGSILFRLNSA